MALGVVSSIVEASKISVDSMGDGKQQTPLRSLDSSKTEITLTSHFQAVPAGDSPEVLSHARTTDHMVTIQWTADNGWENPQIKPYALFHISPIASCLHYATQCFEGMKCYRGYDGKLRLFRPDLNFKRLVISAQRVSLPAFDTLELEKIVKSFMKIEGSKWLPKNEGGRFLYLRPAMIGNGTQLGVQLPRQVLLFVVAVLWPDHSKLHVTDSAADPGLRLVASKANVTRAWPGGFGSAKVGANYGPTFASHGEAREAGFDQVLWLFGDDYQVTEAGASNFFIVCKNKVTGRLELITAPLEQEMILAGITRQSVLDLVRERLGTGRSRDGVHLERLDVVERIFTMSELQAMNDEGRLVEAFVSGTAFFITPVSHINFQGVGINIPVKDASRGSYSATLKKWLSDIMYGVENHSWGVVVDEDD